MARENKRWQALHDAAIDYAQAWHPVQTEEPSKELDDKLAHAEAVLAAAAERYRRQHELEGGR